MAGSRRAETNFQIIADTWIRSHHAAPKQKAGETVFGVD